MLLKKIYKCLIFPYTLLLLYLLFGFGRSQYDTNIVRIIPLYSTVRFAEHSIQWSRVNALLINIFGNILMFVPFGFLGWFFPKFNNLKNLMISFLSAIVISEAVQYFTRLGVFDVDDIILNTFGVWLGFLMKQKIEKSF